MSDSLQPYGLQHTRLPSPSLSPGVCSNSCQLSQWCHPTFSSSVAHPPLQSFPGTGSFPMSQFFTSGGQSIGVSALASVILLNIQDWSPLGLTGLITLQSKGLSSIFPNIQFKASILWGSAFFMIQLSHLCMATGKYIALTWQTFVGKVMSLLYNILSRLVITFHPRSKHLLILWRSHRPLWWHFGSQENFWLYALNFPVSIHWPLTCS